MLSIIACVALVQPTFRSVNGLGLPSSKKDFYFVAMGDNRPAGAGLPPDKTFRDLIEEVATIGPSFVISSGDLLYGNEESVAQYKQEIAWMKPVLSKLPCPFFNAPGNHEINNKPEFLKAYQDAYGACYGSFDFGDLRFVAVCTEFPSDAPSVFEPQLSWVKKTLSSKRPAVVFQHHPIFPRKSNEEKAGSSIANAAEMHEVYQAGNVKLVVEGHDHVYDAQEHDGIDYRIAGGAGAPLDGVAADGGFYHFVLVHVKGTDIEATLIPAGTLEVTPISDGVAAVANYAYNELPVSNVRIASSFKPSSATGDITSKKGKKKTVKVKIVAVRKTAKGYETQVELSLAKARATFVRLSK